jgi:uncharacterized lipoprotein YmbA
MSSKGVLVALPCALAIMLASCTSSPSPKFYVLGVESADFQKEGSTKCVVLGVGPVEIPSYLDRQEVVFRIGPNEVQPSDFHRWAEPIQQGIARVVADSISKAMCVARVEYYPWRTYLSVDFQVSMRVRRFEGYPGREVELLMDWSLFGSNGKRPIKQGSMELREPWPSTSPEEMVSAQSRLLDVAGRRLAEEILAFSR